MMKSWIVAAALIAAGAIGLPAIAHAGAVCEPTKLAQKYPALAGRVLKIGADPQTPPYAMRDPTDFSKMVGSDVDLATAVLDCEGIKHKMFLGGWSGLMPATASGQVDVFWDNLYYTSVRAKQLDFVLYMQAATGALTQAGNPKKITGMAGSCGTTYAVGLGTVEDTAAEKQNALCKSEGKPSMTIMTYPDLASGIRLVQSGRADIMMTDLAMVDSLATAHPDIYSHAYTIMTGFDIGAGVKKGDTELLDAIAEGLRIMQANGTEKAILAKYKLDPSLEIPVTVKTQ
jgi:polar amino acid transport system substrate-binding protein